MNRIRKLNLFFVFKGLPNMWNVMDVHTVFLIEQLNKWIQIKEAISYELSLHV